MNQMPVTPAETAIVTLMKSMANYNLWVNVTLINWLRTKPADVLEKEVPSSFSSINTTLTHMLNAQRYWLSVIRKDANPGAELFSGTLEETFTALLDHSAEMADFIDTMTAPGMMEKTVIENKWFRSERENYDYIMQAVIHGTYHRGQVITIGRNLGFTDAPMTDYNYYNVFGR
jgi:uncharacterized damage-inducible protein DinB